MIRTIQAMALVAVLALALAAPIWGERQEAEQEDKARDPVCHIMVRKDPALSTEHRGQVYYFCMKADMEAFKRDPDRYLRNQPRPPVVPDRR